MQKTNNGWVAYIRIDNSQKKDSWDVGNRELWIHSPDGTEQKVAEHIYGLVTLSNNGDIAYMKGNFYENTGKLYVSNQIMGQRRGEVRIPFTTTNLFPIDGQWMGATTFNQVYRINTDQPDPEILFVSPKDGQYTYSDTLTIVVGLKLSDAGIDPASILVKLDDIQVPAEYVSGSSHIIVQTDSLDPSTEHKISIDLKDRNGYRMDHSEHQFSILMGDPSKNYYVALGDSLAAGMTPTKSIDFGYPSYISNYLFHKDALYGTNTNFIVPGYTSSQILADIQNNALDWPGGSDIKGHLARAQIVTIDAGTNEFLQALETNQYQLSPEQAKQLIDSVSGNMSQIVAQIKSLNPAVQVYVMGYYDALHNAPFTDIQKIGILQVLDGLNDAVSQAVQAKGGLFVPVKDAIADDYNLNLPTTDIHPSLKGYQVIADEFKKFIQPQLLWSEHQIISTKEITESSLKLQWAPAGRETVSYSVYKDGQNIATLPSNMNEFDVNGLKTNTTYEFSVEASSDHQHWSKNGPKITAKTVKGPFDLDTTGPIISNVEPTDGMAVTISSPIISAKLIDENSGINTDSIRVNLDGNAVQAKYDLSIKTVIAETYGLANGKHHLEIYTEDRAGNVSFSSTVFLKKDPEPIGKLQFSSILTKTDESSGTVTATVYRSGGSRGEITVRYTTKDRSAVAGQDYLSSSGQLHFADGEMKKTIQVKIVNDTVRESLETLYLGLYAPSDKAILGADTGTTFIIRDDD
ncbi:Calx-beta domain-containing protein [Paenibacillus hexagrammi]|uniref:GDSL-type esterase/lipase family protein n=1 Tax=Paenibacillus hexagrammi TaxID=2908839 RepID=A0ABY3SLL2_9BACL|nr:Calx-beta domain-containing protein [Paenibacillus sp. YPD9-1]UJF34290.1 GDSL-type esterase/lipase family protein [Paenibacillus sp. YPD9-1]